MIQSSDSNMPIQRKEVDKSVISNRPSYTPKNAEDFRAVFDKMILTQQNQEITCAETGLKSNTLYIKAQDALKWLVDNDLKDRDKYGALRSKIAIRKKDEYILIYFKPSIGNIIESSAASVRLSKEWKDELLGWLVNAQDGEMWEKKGVMLEPDDKEWITNLVAGLDGTPELEVGTSNIRIMR